MSHPRATTRRCDVAIVGGGPAGTSAARAAARAGATVILIEKRQEIGVPVRCAELVPALLMRETEVSSQAIVQRTSGIVTHLPGGEEQRIQAPGVMLERAVFDQDLAQSALTAGAEVWTSARFTSMRGDGTLVVERETGETLVSAGSVIGADGPRSGIGSHIKLRNEDFVVAKQAVVLLTNALEECHIFFDPIFRGGYGWLFPKGEAANLGVGVADASASILDEAFEHMMSLASDLGLVIGRHILGRTAGSIPVGGPLGSARVGSVLLAGDAAGQTHPITGAGIHAAVSCGALAGEAAARFAASGDEQDLKRYEKEWRALWRGVLRTARKRRSELLERWDEDLDAAVRDCWVTFEEYYRR